MLVEFTENGISLSFDSDVPDRPDNYGVQGKYSHKSCVIVDFRTDSFMMVCFQQN